MRLGVPPAVSGGPGGDGWRAADRDAGAGTSRLRRVVATHSIAGPSAAIDPITASNARTVRPDVFSCSIGTLSAAALGGAAALTPRHLPRRAAARRLRGLPARRGEGANR